uniref:Uncharacterized protein n=1 Tax=Oryza barthii TaxID=65489 RepID=A0A0D3GMV4_9ORYZ
MSLRLACAGGRSRHFGLLRVPAGLAACVLARHGVTTPGSLATLYAGTRALDGAFFLVSPGPNRCLQPPTPPLRLLRPRAAARPLRPRSPTVCRRRSRVLSPLTPPLRLL